MAMGYHGQQALPSIWQSDVSHAATRLLKSENMFCELTNHAVCIWWMLEKHHLPYCSIPSVKLGAGGIVVWGCFSGFVLDLLVPVKRNLNASVYQEILDIPAWPCLSTQSKVHKTMVRWLWYLEECEWPAQCPEPNPKCDVIKAYVCLFCASGCMYQNSPKWYPNALFDSGAKWTSRWKKSIGQKYF